MEEKPSRADWLPVASTRRLSGAAHAGEKSAGMRFLGTREVVVNQHVRTDPMAQSIEPSRRGASNDAPRTLLGIHGKLFDKVVRCLPPLRETRVGKCRIARPFLEPTVAVDNRPNVAGMVVGFLSNVIKQTLLVHFREEAFFNVFNEALPALLLRSAGGLLWGKGRTRALQFSSDFGWRFEVSSHEWTKPMCKSQPVNVGVNDIRGPGCSHFLKEIVVLSRPPP